MELLDKAIYFEKDLFLWINSQHTPFLDAFMYGYTVKFTWIPLVFVLLYVSIYKVNRRESFMLIAAMLLVGTLCDQISSDLVKNAFECLRPTHHPEFKDTVNTVYGYRGGRFGFTSSHAANGIGIALFTSLVIRNWRYTIVGLLWVSITCYSRVYLGVHFLIDIVGGLILGVVIALFVYWIYQKVRQRVMSAEYLGHNHAIVQGSAVNMLMYTTLLTVVSIIIVSGIISLSGFWGY